MRADELAYTFRMLGVGSNRYHQLTKAVGAHIFRKNRSKNGGVTNKSRRGLAISWIYLTYQSWERDPFVIFRTSALSPDALSDSLGLQEDSSITNHVFCPPPERKRVGKTFIVRCRQKSLKISTFCSQSFCSFAEMSHGMSFRLPV